MMLIDSHCHFDFPYFSAPSALWKKCQAADIQQLIIPGVKASQWQSIATLANSLEGVFHAAGVHPWFIQEQPKGWPELLATHIEANQPIAIGECGLDKHIDTAIELQQQVLAVHIELANQHKLPLIMHSVGTHDVLHQQLKATPCLKGGVIHGFNGSLEQARRFTELGFYLGIGGSITYSRAKKTRKAVTDIDSRFLLLETDAPDMPPAGIKKGENSPLYLPQIAQSLAILKNCSVEDIAAITTANCRKLFALP